MNRYRLANNINSVREEVITLLRSGLSCTEVARRTGRDRMSIRRLAILEKIPITRGKPGSKPGDHYMHRGR